MTPGETEMLSFVQSGLDAHKSGGTKPEVVRNE